MAKRKSTNEREIEQMMRNELDILGRKVTVLSSRNSKISNKQKAHLRDSANWRVKPFDTLVVSQYKYGKYNTPKGQATPSDRDNIKNTPLLNSIKENVPEAVKVIAKNLVDLLIAPIIKK